MRGCGQRSSARVIATVTAITAVVIAVSAASWWYVSGHRDAHAPQASAPAATGTAPAPAAAVAARLDGQITRIATGPGDENALSLVERAHTAVIAPEGDAHAAAGLALELRAPVVLLPPARRGATATRDDAVSALRRLRVVRAVAIGARSRAVAHAGDVHDVVELATADPDAADIASVIRRAERSTARGSAKATGWDSRTVRRLRRHHPPPPAATGVAVVVRPRDAGALPAVAAARAVGHTVIATAARDLRADPRLVERMGRLADGGAPPPVVLAGARFAGADPTATARHAAVAATGTQLPGGGQLVVHPQRPAARRYVGLYGVTTSPALGALGEQPVQQSITRAKQLARRYAGEVGDDVEVIPCFEIIATVASGSAGDDGDYSAESAVADLRPTIDAARRAGVYVLLDLQPGRTSFLRQAKRYRPLLRQPHVGLALDPEWRLGRGEKHLEQIGSVDIAEVNAVVGWLADLVDRNRLPQKMLLLHQFRLSMLDRREHLDTSRDALAYVIQMDGNGSQGQKLETWRAVTADPPDRVRFGWKNFYDEDLPLRSPAETMAVRPHPVFVSYQ